MPFLLYTNNLCTVDTLSTKTVYLFRRKKIRFHLLTRDIVDQLIGGVRLLCLRSQ